MTIAKQIEEDYIRSFKDRNELAVLTLRQLKTALANAAIANKREALTEADVVKIFKTEVKKRREAIELYRQGGRPELADKEQQEVAIISKYLPAELSSEQISVVVDQVIGELQTSSAKDTGRVMAAVMAKLQGQADGSVVSKLVKEKLSN